MLLEWSNDGVQSPTGSNSQVWLFLCVEDANKKRQLVYLYGQGVEPYVTSPHSEYAPGDIRAERA